MTDEKTAPPSDSDLKAQEHIAAAETILADLTRYGPDSSATATLTQEAIARIQLADWYSTHGP